MKKFGGGVTALEEEVEHEDSCLAQRQSQIVKVGETSTQA